MTTFFQRQITCANCKKSSGHQILGSTNAFGSSDLDLRPPEMQRSTMGSWLQECPHCRYIAPDLGEAAGDLDVVTTPEYRAVLDDERFPELARRFLAYALLLKADPVSAGYARLRAAWVCDDAGRAERAAECRGAAADGMAAGRPFPDTERGVTAGAVLVDVLRRGGRFEESAAECDSLLEYESAKDVLQKVLEYQARLIAARDTAAHTIADAK